jgi:hypothetical protein
MKDFKKLKRLRRWWIILIVAASLANFRSKSAENEFSVNNNKIIHERVISNQEFNSWEENDRQVFLAKTERLQQEKQGQVLFNSYRLQVVDRVVL